MYLFPKRSTKKNPLEVSMSNKHIGQARARKMMNDNHNCFSQKSYVIKVHSLIAKVTHSTLLRQNLISDYYASNEGIKITCIFYTHE